MSGRLVAVGRFDGVHRGHQHLLKEGRTLARVHGLRLTAYTFPPRGPSLLTQQAKERVLAHLVDEVLTVPWEQVQDMSPEQFVGEELVGRLQARGVLVGPDHRFGRGRAGDIVLLKRLSFELDLGVYVADPLRLHGHVVSANRIRKLLRDGDVTGAEELLGRAPWLSGMPVSGAGLARTLGYPTVNLELFPELLRPKEGVYAAWAHWPGGEGGALFYIGRRPTFAHLPPSAELHLLSPPRGEVPGPVEVHLLHFLRADEKFPDAEALARAIEGDRKKAEELLARILPPVPLVLG